MLTQKTYSHLINTKQNENIQLSKILKNLLTNKRITLTSVARATGISIKTLHGWSQGIEPKSIVKVKKLADYFEISIEELCFGVKNKEKENSLHYLDKFEIIVFKRMN